MNKSRLTGTVLTMISAIIFGATAILCKYAVAGGSNSIMLTFSRMFISIPFLYAMVKIKGISIKVSKKEFLHIVILCGFGSVITTLTLYSSYDYIPVGIATSIHFIYPAIVSIVCILLFKEKASLSKIIAIVLSSIGVLMMMEGDIASSGKTGILLSILSGFTYAFYILYMDKSGLSKMYAFKLSFYICTVNAVMMFLYGCSINKIVFKLPLWVWGLQTVISLSLSVFAISFLQIGIKLIGPSNAAIFSLLEPISGIVLGVIVLQEACSIKTLTGCVLIIVAVAILSARKKK